MSNIPTIYAKKQPKRPHFIIEWCEKHGLNQSALAKKINADPSIVNRWFKGGSPSEPWQYILGEFFGCGREGIFRHPDDDWMTKFFKDRSKEEIERAKTMLEAAFPKKSGTHND